MLSVEEMTRKTGETIETTTEAEAFPFGSGSRFHSEASLYLEAFPQRRSKEQEEGEMVRRELDYS